MLHLRQCLALACLGASLLAPHDRRIVDRVTVGDVRNEQEHAYDGDGVTLQVWQGRASRQASGWMRYALSVFDDTEVTVAATFAGSSEPRRFDLVVENKVVSSHLFNSRDSSTVEFRVPLEITSGRTNILVMLRASGGPTPALLSLRSVQDHNE